MRTIAAYITLLLAFSLAVAGCSSRKSNKPHFSRTIAIDRTVLDSDQCDTIRLGRIRSGECIEYDMAVKNLSQEAFALTNVRSSCNCTMFDYSTAAIMPGDSTALQIRFDSQGYFGWMQKEVWLQTSLSTRGHCILLEIEIR